MSQEIEWSSRAPNTSKAAHRDYEGNLHYAREHCVRVWPDLPQGMMVQIASSQWLTNNLLMVSWNPGRYAKTGICAHPIDLNQSRADLQKEIRAVHQYFILKIHKFNER